MNTVQLGHIKLTSPKSWNQLSEKQLRYIGSQWRGWKYILSSKQNGIENKRQRIMLQNRIILLQVLLNINPLNKASLRKRFFDRVTPDQMLDLIPLTDFIFNENSLTKNILPVVDGLYGPCDDLNCFTIGEFAYAETAFIRFSKNGKLDDLNYLCSVLYRTGSEENRLNGDPRDKFNPNHIESRIKKVSGWHESTKQSIALFYMGCRNQLVKKYDLVFNGKKQGKNKNWANVIIDLAGVKFGTVDQTAEQSVHTVLIYLQDLKENTPKK